MILHSSSAVSVYPGNSSASFWRQTDGTSSLWCPCTCCRRPLCDSAQTSTTKIFSRKCSKNGSKLHGGHSACAKPPVDFKTKVLLLPGQASPGQTGNFVLKSTGGFAQAEWSTYIFLQDMFVVQIFRRKIFAKCGLEHLYHIRTWFLL